MVLPGPDTGCPHAGLVVCNIRTKEVNWYVPLTLRFLRCL